MKKKSELEKRLKVLDHQLDVLGWERQSVQQALRVIEYGFDVGDTVKQGTRTGIVENWGYWPKVRWLTKDGTPGGRVSMVPAGSLRVQRRPRSKPKTK